jgi:phosphatidylserine/phosphatidylglycerophosphate/cardiolipin synthase-like enzyme
MKKNINIIIILIIVIELLTFSLGAFAKTEVYFSLYDDPESIIIKSIENAEESINIAMYSLTDSEISRAIVRAKERGVVIKIYLDSKEVNAEHSKSRFFIKEGIENVRLSSNRYLMHNKFAIIDNKIVITGSYNWTASAGQRNDENLLVLDEEKIVKKYQDYFYHLWDNKYSIEKYNELINHSDIGSEVSQNSLKEFLISVITQIKSFKIIESFLKD